MMNKKEVVVPYLLAGSLAFVTLVLGFSWLTEGARIRPEMLYYTIPFLCCISIAAIFFWLLSFKKQKQIKELTMAEIELKYANFKKAYHENPNSPEMFEAFRKNFNHAEINALVKLGFVKTTIAQLQ